MSLTIGILCVVIFLFFFLGILQDYRAHDPLIRADLRIANLVSIFRSPDLTSAMIFLTGLAKWRVVFAGIIVVGFALFATNLLPYFVALVASTAGGEILVALIKNSVQRPRPPLASALVIENGFSFPSGHAFIAVAFYGLLAYILWRTSNTKTMKLCSLAGGVALVGLIALSRVYLGVHWSSDVLASLALGIAWVGMIIIITEHMRKTPWIKENMRIMGRRFFVVPFTVLFLLWFSWVTYAFQNHPLVNQHIVTEHPVLIQEDAIPEELFSSLPHSSESITGIPIEPISIVVVGNYEELIHTFELAGWVQPEPITIRATWRNTIASIFNEPYPQAIGTPTFWNSQPNDFAFQLPTETIRQRHHIHFWSTPFLTDKNHHIWFATAHFDKGVNFKTIIPTHTIDPLIDNERAIVRDTLLKTRQVRLIKEIQVTNAGEGKNPAGDTFVTDGKAFVLFLRD